MNKKGFTLIDPSRVTGGTRVKRGFTLIEIIVSTAIFTVVVTVAIGALTSLNKTSREARSLRVVMDNANSALDSMSRTMRMGIRFDGGCNADCVCGGTDMNTMRDNTVLLTTSGTGGNSCIRFYGPITGSPTLSEIRYKYDGISKSVQRSVDGGITYVNMTAPEVEVSSMTFFVNGTTLGDVGGIGDQPVVTMLMSGIARVSTYARPFSIQTTIAPRTPNLKIITPS